MLVAGCICKCLNIKGLREGLKKVNYPLLVNKGVGGTQRWISDWEGEYCYFFCG